MKRWLGLVGIVVVALALGGTGVGLALEEQDQFCASCHTEPEVTYVRQAQVPPGPRSHTLAAFHHRLEVGPMSQGDRVDAARVNCIGCHGGVGPAARLRTLFELGVGDGLAFVAGQYEQPAKTHRPLPDVNCTQCHASAIAIAGFENHFHNKLADPTAPPLACVSCHVSHTSQVDPREKYIRRAIVFPRCNECHAVMGGPTSLR